MHKILKDSLKVFLILFFLSFSYFKAYGDEMEKVGATNTLKIVEVE